MDDVSGRKSTDPPAVEAAGAVEPAQVQQESCCSKCGGLLAVPAAADRRAHPAAHWCARCASATISQISSLASVLNQLASPPPAGPALPLLPPAMGRQPAAASTTAEPAAAESALPQALPLPAPPAHVPLALPQALGSGGLLRLPGVTVLYGPAGPMLALPPGIATATGGGATALPARNHLEFMQMNGLLSAMDSAAHANAAAAGAGIAGFPNLPVADAAQPGPEGEAAAPGCRKCKTCNLEKPLPEFLAAAAPVEGGEARYSAQCRGCDASRKRRRKQHEPSVEAKVCAQCNALKAASEFHADPYTRSGLCRYCRDCVMARRWARRTMKPTVASKACSMCQVVKNSDQFTRNTFTSDGLASWCRLCTVSATKRRRSEQAAEKALQQLAHN